MQKAGIVNAALNCSTLWTMDRVRLGRALGYGARHAMKTVVAAVDAATTEAPSSTRASPGSSQTAATPPLRGAAMRSTTPATPQTPSPTPIATADRATAQGVRQARNKQQGVKQGTRRFGEAVWRPFVRLSGVLGLEVSGVFFGIFALFALGAVWRLRADWHSQSPGHSQLIVAAAMLAVFGYFCVSNFVRARRRERSR